jgi:hypothetical protein
MALPVGCNGAEDRPRDSRKSCEGRSVHHVAQQTERHARVERRLVFHQQVHQRVAAASRLHLVEQIGAGVTKVLVDEGAGTGLERRKVKVRLDLGRKHQLEFAACEIVVMNPRATDSLPSSLGVGRNA